MNRWEAARPARDYAVHLAVWQQATRMLAWADELDGPLECTAPACPWALVVEVSETRPPR